MNKVDVSGNPKLEVLFCSGIGLNELNVSKNKELSVLYCANNNLQTLDVSQNKMLTDLTCDGLKNGIDVSHNENLERLICRNCNLTSLDVSNNKKLISLTCQDNNLSTDQINKLFHSLPDGEIDNRGFPTRGIQLQGNPGFDTCDHSIYKAKGWGNYTH